MPADAHWWDTSTPPSDDPTAAPQANAAPSPAGGSSHWWDNPQTKPVGATSAGTTTTPQSTLAQRQAAAGMKPGQTIADALTSGNLGKVPTNQQIATNVAKLAPPPKPNPASLAGHPALEAANQFAHGVTQGMIGPLTATGAPYGSSVAAVVPGITAPLSVDPSPDFNGTRAGQLARFVLDQAGQFAGFSAGAGRYVGMAGAPLRAAASALPSVRVLLPDVAGRVPGFLTRNLASRMLGHAVSSGADGVVYGLLDTASQDYSTYKDLIQRGNVAGATSLLLRRLGSNAAMFAGFGAVTGGLIGSSLQRRALGRAQVEATDVNNLLNADYPNIGPQFAPWARMLLLSMARGEMTKGQLLETLSQINDPTSPAAISNRGIPAPRVGGLPFKAEELSPEQFAESLNARAQRPTFGITAPEPEKPAPQDKYVRRGDQIVGEQTALAPQEGVARGGQQAPAEQQPARAASITIPSTAVNAKGNQTIRDIANTYARDHGLPQVTSEKSAVLDPKEGRRIADAYDAAQDEPDNPMVQQSYKEFARQVNEQADYLRAAGIKAEPWTGPGQPYANSKEMMADVRDNKHIYYFRTDEGNPIHAALSPADNDTFRWVHDVFGHSQSGNEFGPKGEYNAFKEHSKMFYGDALRALPTETLAQNAWFNFGSTNEGKPLPDRVFAPQKATVLPDDVWMPHLGEQDNLAKSGLNARPAIPLRSLRYYTNPETGTTAIDIYYPKLLHTERDDLKRFLLGPGSRIEVTPNTENYPLIHDTILPRIPDAALDQEALRGGRVIIDFNKLSSDQQNDLLRAGAMAHTPRPRPGTVGSTVNLQANQLVDGARATFDKDAERRGQGPLPGPKLGIVADTSPQWMLDFVTGALQRVSDRLRSIVPMNRAIKSAQIIGAAKLLRNGDWGTADPELTRKAWDAEMVQELGQGVVPHLDKVWAGAQKVATDAATRTMGKYPSTKAIVDLARKGMAGGEWYGDFRRNWMEAFGGNFEQFKRFATYYALTSAGSDAMGSNITMALKTYLQDRTGGPEAPVTGVMYHKDNIARFRLAQTPAAVDEFIQGMGNKQRDFVRALTGENTTNPVVDGQVSRGFGFPDTVDKKTGQESLPAINETEYNLMSQTIHEAAQQLSQELGVQVSPIAVQAAVWHTAKLESGKGPDTLKTWDDVMAAGKSDVPFRERIKLINDWQRERDGQHTLLAPMLFGNEETTRAFLKDPNGEPYAVMTAYNNSHPLDPRVEADVNRGYHPHALLLQDLADRGYGADRTTILRGVYNGLEEPSVFVRGMDEKEAMQLGRKYGQGSVLTRYGLLDTSPRATDADVNGNVKDMRDAARTWVGPDVDKLTVTELRELVRDSKSLARGFVTRPTGRFFVGQEAEAQPSYSTVPGGVSFSVELEPPQPNVDDFEEIHPSASGWFQQAAHAAARAVSNAVGSPKLGISMFGGSQDGGTQLQWDPATRSYQTVGTPKAPPDVINRAAYADAAVQNPDPVRAQALVSRGDMIGKVRIAPTEEATGDTVTRIAQATGQDRGTLLKFSPYLGEGAMSRSADSMLSRSADATKRMAKSYLDGNTTLEQFRAAVNRHFTLINRISAADKPENLALVDLRQMMRTDSMIPPAGGDRLSVQYKGPQLAQQLVGSGNPSKVLGDVLRPSWAARWSTATMVAKLTSPQPTEKKALGDVITTMVAPFDTAGEAAAEAIRTGFGMLQPRQRFMSEAGAQLLGDVAGIHAGVQAFVKAMRGLSQKAILDNPGNRSLLAGPLGFPLRPLAAFTDMFAEINRRGYLYKMAARRAFQEGTSYGDLPGRIAEHLANPDEATISGAKRFMETQTMVEDLGAFGQMLQGLRGQNTMGRLVYTELPFVKVPVNLVRWAGRHSPLGFGTALFHDTGLAKITGNLEDAYQKPDTLEMYGRAMTGTALLTSFAVLAANGGITGGGPKDPRMKALWLRTHQPHSINANGMAFDYSRWHPIAPLLDAAATAVENVQAGEKPSDVAVATLTAVGQSLTTLPMIEQVGFLNDLLNAKSTGEAANVTKSVASSFVMGLLPIPAMARDIRSAMDPYSRIASNFTDAVKNQLPGLSTQVPMRTDVAGQPVMQGAGLLTPFVGKLVPQVQDPMADRMRELGIAPDIPQTAFTLGGKRYRLTDDQKTAVKQAQWDLLRSRLSPLIGSPGDAPPEYNAERLKNLSKQLNQVARTKVILQLLRAGELQRAP